MITSRGLKFIIVCLCAGLLLTIVPVNFVNEVNADTWFSYEGQNPSLENVYRSVEDCSYSVEVRNVSSWSGHANIEFKITNTGSSTIHDWRLTFDYGYSIENPFNCYIIEHQANLYTFGNNNWNQDIKPGQFVTVGFTAASSDGSSISDTPSFYLLNTKTVTLSSSDLSYRFEQYSDWGAGYNGALIFTNNSGETIRDWSVTFNSNRPITQIDSAVLTTNSDGTYTIANDGNNQNIGNGQSYRVGVQGGSHDSSSAFTLTDYTVSATKLAYSLEDDTNDNGILDVLEIDFGVIITATPTTEVTATPTNTFIPTATNTPTSTNTPTATVTPSPTNKPTATNTPTVTVTATATATASVTVSPTYTVTPTATATVSVTASPTVTSTPIVTVTPTISITPTSTPIVTYTPTPVITIDPTGTNTPTPSATPTNIPDDIDYYTDSDSDGLPDYFEDENGTDKNKKDTDGDGVDDFNEYLLSTDPLTADTNGDRDYDGDGLSNAQESSLGTNLMNRDSDFDGLSDYEEVRILFTDPNEFDSDNDGMSDSSEVDLGSDPTVPDSDTKRYQELEFIPTSDSGLTGVTKVTVGGYISGAIKENTKIKDIYGNDPQTTSIEALVGDPVSIESTGEFDSMEITFYYSSELDPVEQDLMIMWYDESNGEYVVLTENVWVNYSSNTISVYTDHFSKYFLINEEVWVRTWLDASSKTSQYSQLGNKYYMSAQSFLDFLISQYGDSDGDGLPDPMETKGMMDNKGHIVFTDPNNPDSDGDGLSDGYEMGTVKLLEVIYDRSPYSYYISSWAASYGHRPEDHIWFSMRSDPNNPDSDGDGALDGEDATPNTKNRPINYILCGIDSKNDKEILKTKKAYLKAFKALNQEVIVLDIFDGSDYQTRLAQYFNSMNLNVPLIPTNLVRFTFRLLQCNLGEDVITGELEFSFVDKMIIISHSSNEKLLFDEYLGDSNGGSISCFDIIDSITPSCLIKTLDIQGCKCGLPANEIVLYNDDGTEDKLTNTCVAFEFVKKTNIEKVYAWTAECAFRFGKYNCSTQGGIYQVYYMKDNVILHFTVDTDIYILDTLACYAPLQY